MTEHRCPITYDIIPATLRYSTRGLKLLSPHLQSLADLPLSSEALRLEAYKRAEKMSIQGVQYKVSAKLNIKAGCFELVNQNGKYILKPQSDMYQHLPENEDVSMRLAKTLGIEVPLHGLIYNTNNELTYFIKRFDRAKHHDKIPMEDFAQLAGQTRDTKYNFSTERLVTIIDRYCTFPLLEKKKMFERTVFNYIIGNEDMHLKNFALITRNNKIELAPAFDFLNTTIALHNPKDEMALPLNGKKNNLTKKDFIDYFAMEKLGLNENIVNKFIQQLAGQIPLWHDLIEICFLPQTLKAAYWQLIQQRLQVFSIR
jgi:serine/threonine-protein kinase HipA